MPVPSGRSRLKPALWGRRPGREVYSRSRSLRAVRLDETVVLVTGAAHGLGRAVAEACVREGADVVCADVAGDALADAVAEVRDAGPGEATAVVADLRSWDDVRAMAGEARRACGRIDALVNNAGVKQLTVTGDERPAWEVPVGTWDEVLTVNLRGTFLCTRAVVPAMVDRGAGRVMHVTSGHGKSGRARRAPYVASKFGVEGFHRTLARELDGTGVDSLAFTPPGGGVRTREAEFLADPSSMRHEPEVVGEPVVRLLAGEGRNGGRYRGEADGEGFVETDYVLD